MPTTDALLFGIFFLAYGSIFTQFAFYRTEGLGASRQLARLAVVWPVMRIWPAGMHEPVRGHALGSAPPFLSEHM